MILDKDTLSVVQSYFELEEILIIYADDAKQRDLLITKCKLPPLWKLIGDGKLLSVKYLIDQLNFPVNEDVVHISIKADNLEIFEYIIHKFIEDDERWKLRNYFDYYIITYDSVNIYIKYLENNIKSNDFPTAMEHRSFKIMKFLSTKVNISNINIQNEILCDDIVMIHKLHDLGYEFTEEHLQFASFQGMLDIVKYFISIGILPNTEILNFIISENNMEMVKFFIEFGIKPNDRTYRIIENYDLTAIREYLSSKNLFKTNN